MPGGPLGAPRRPLRGVEGSCWGDRVAEGLLLPLQGAFAAPYPGLLRGLWFPGWSSGPCAILAAHPALFWSRLILTVCTYHGGALSAAAWYPVSARDVCVHGRQPTGGCLPCSSGAASVRPCMGIVTAALGLMHVSRTALLVPAPRICPGRQRHGRLLVAACRAAPWHPEPLRQLRLVPGAAGLPRLSAGSHRQHAWPALLGCSFSREATWLARHISC